jgi:hypothetical protein
MPRTGLRPRHPPGRAHCCRHARQCPTATSSNLVQRPPACRNGCDQPKQILLVAHHPEIADHLGAAGDRARQVGQHPDPVMHQQSAAGSAFDRPAISPVLSASPRSKASRACDTIPVPPAVTFQPLSQPVAFT